MEELQLNCFEFSNEYIPTNGTIRVQAQADLFLYSDFPTIEYCINIYSGSVKLRKIILKSGGDGGISSPETNERRRRHAMMVVRIADHIAYELEDVCLIKGTKLIRSYSSNIKSFTLPLPPSFIME